MALSKQEIAQLYRKRAKRYNLTANLYYLVGYREHAYRRMAIRTLELERGDTVVEIGCGTGLNFGLLEAAIGTDGRIIGVDLTAEMLDRARARVEQNGWSNVELVQSDAADYRFPDHLDGAISTFALTLVPEYDRVIKNGATALSGGKKFVVLDFKNPDGWLARLRAFWLLITRPFGVTLDLAQRRPWESMAQYLTNCRFQKLYFGLTYIAVGEAR